MMLYKTAPLPIVQKFDSIDQAQYNQVIGIDKKLADYLSFLVDSSSDADSYDALEDCVIEQALAYMEAYDQTYRVHTYMCGDR